MLEDAGESIPDEVRKAEELTPYAVFTRYPGPARPISAQEYGAAVEAAEAAVRWVGERL